MKAVVYGVNPLGWLTCKWLRHFWRGCLTSRLAGVSLRRIDPPALPGDEWVRCRTLMGGICGSDLAIIQQRQRPDSFLQSFSTLPAVLGHENVAVVDEAGPAVDPMWVGKRVTVDPGLSCRVRGIDPPCRSCRAGRFGACENLSPGPGQNSPLPPGTGLGYCGPVGGSWGEYFVAHACQLIEPPSQLANELLLLTDPLACSLHAMLRADLSRAENILIVGAGMLGLGVVWALRAAGWAGNIDIVARYEHQAAAAKNLGADEVLSLPRRQRDRFEAIARRVGGRVTQARFGNCMLVGGYDAVFECVGRSDTIEQALKWTRAGGQAILLSTGHGRGADLTSVWFSELAVLGVCGRAEENFQGRRVHSYHLVHEFMLSSAKGLRELLTHTFDLEDYRRALAVAMYKRRHESIKIAFRFADAP